MLPIVNKWIYNMTMGNRCLSGGKELWEGVEWDKEGVEWDRVEWDVEG